MYRIGEFSKETGLSIRTLRYYDSIGLLKPGHVDRFTGYRYYTEENLYEVYVINLLKDAFFSLEEIIAYREALTNEIIDNKINELEEKKEELDKSIELLQEMKNNIQQEENQDNIITLSRNLNTIKKAS